MEPPKHERYDLAPFDLAFLFLLGHCYEDIMPSAEHHVVTTSNKHEDKRPRLRMPTQKEGLSLGPS